jgi:hypothetical protein
MTCVLPLLKRKKAAPTCTLSLTSVSVHRSAVPFPSSDLPDIPSLAATSSNSAAAPPPPRPRQRTHASLLRRKRCALGTQPDKPSSSPSSSPTPPRKRARKSSLSPPSFYPSPSSLRSLPTKKNSAAAALGFHFSPFTGDLMFLCNVYRSIAWTRLQREFSKAEASLSSMMDVDMDIGSELLSDLDKQESVFMDRLTSYLIFHEINPRWLDVTPHLSPPSHSSDWADDMDIDSSRDSSPLAPSAPPPPPTPLQLPINPQPQIIASLLFRHRHRVKLSSGTAKSRLLAQIAHAEPDRSRRTPRSPLASVSVS